MQNNVDRAIYALIALVGLSAAFLVELLPNYMFAISLIYERF